MPENQAVSLLWLKHVPDMAYIPCPKNCLEMSGNDDASLSCPGHGLYTVSQKLPRNARKDTAWTLPEHGLYSLPRNCPEIPISQAMTLPWPEHILNMAYTSCSRNCLEMTENQAASWTCPVYYVP
ncbi:Hypothetical predicted protein [Olea europaea subsp. europaea]|uniref:Uncharacterized protein n=1 Tax=Olea europaea subsp. europaea TaxID=158383 RepID=A0A8S0TQS0_OLEEU|nr:Hypothetical predicted protein [Olea europaea subsp. europaea]